jgi:hypothetical protein
MLQLWHILIQAMSRLATWHNNLLSPFTGYYGFFPVFGNTPPRYGRRIEWHVSNGKGPSLLDFQIASRRKRAGNPTDKDINGVVFVFILAVVRSEVVLDP